MRVHHAIVTHHLPLYFPEAERYLHSTRAEWFTELLLLTPCPARPLERPEPSRWQPLRLQFEFDTDLRASWYRLEREDGIDTYAASKHAALVMGHRLRAVSLERGDLHHCVVETSQNFPRVSVHR
jgi:hypothetical protein